MMNELKTKYLSIGEIFKLAAKTYVNQFNYVLLLTLLVYVPMLLFLFLMPESLQLETINIEMLTKNDLVVLAGQGYYRIGVFVLFIPMSIGYVTYITLKSLDKTSLNVKELSKNIFLNLGKYIVTGILYMAIIVITGPTIVLPIYFAVIFIFFAPFVLVSGKWGFRPLMESRQLVKGRFFHVLGFLVLLFIASTGFTSLFEIVTLMLFEVNNFAFVLWINILLQIFSTFFVVVFAIKFINLFSVNYLKEGEETINDNITGK